MGGNIAHSNHDEKENLFPRQVFFAMAGDKEGWSKLARNLRAEIYEGLIQSYSRPLVFLLNSSFLIEMAFT